MALVNQTLKLEITPGGVPPILHVTEYDENMQVEVQLLQRGQPFEIPAGTTAKVEGTLAGHPFSVDATVDGSTVTFELDKSMTAFSGRAWTKIKLTKDSKPVQSCGFWMEVDSAGVEAGDVIGAPGFEEQIADAAAEWMEQQGFTSPTVSTTPITGGNRVTFTDKDGPHSIDVMNGQDGEPGEDGDFILPSGGEAGQALLSDGADGAEWGQAGLESVDFEDFVFGETYKYRKDASEVQIFLRYQGAITGILKGLLIPVEQGQTLVLDNLRTVSRNGFSAVEIWSSYSTENNADYGKGIALRSRVQNYDTSPTGDGKYPVTSASAKYAYINLDFVRPGNSYSYPYYYSAYVLDEGEEQQASISRWYMNSQKKNFVVNQNQNKTLFWSLFQAVSPMVNANVLVMGDSITEFSAKDSNAIDGRTTRPYFGYGWVTRILRKYNMTADIYGYASSRWWTQESGGSTTHSCVDTVTTVCANEDLPEDKYQYIIIEYGTNDIMFRPGGFGSVNDAASSDVGCSTVAAAKYCINTLRTKFPKANIVVVMPTIIASRYQTDQETYITLMDKVFNSLGVKRAYPRYDAGITLSMMRDDGIHLDYWENNTHNNNTEAVRRFSKCVEAAMMEV